MTAGDGGAVAYSLTLDRLMTLTAARTMGIELPLVVFDEAKQQAIADRAALAEQTLDACADPDTTVSAEAARQAMDDAREHHWLLTAMDDLRRVREAMKAGGL